MLTGRRPLLLQRLDHQTFGPIFHLLRPPPIGSGSPRLIVGVERFIFASTTEGFGVGRPRNRFVRGGLGSVQAADLVPSSVPGLGIDTDRLKPW